MRILRGLRGVSRHIRAIFPALLGISFLQGCAEVELGAQAYKSLNRAATPAADSDAPPPRVAQANSSIPVTETSENGLTGDIDRSYRSAPEVFRANGVATWDGSRTLRGIWIAHPLARKAMRVRIINPKNRRAVDGALFRRDASLAGPSLLVSSDAAQALGLRPGEEQALQIFGVEKIREVEAPPTEPTVAAATAVDGQARSTPATGAPSVETDTAAAAATQPAVAEAPAAKTPFGKVAVEVTEEDDAVATVDLTPAVDTATAASAETVAPQDPVASDSDATAEAAPRSGGGLTAAERRAAAQAEAEAEASSEEVLATITSAVNGATAPAETATAAPAPAAPNPQAPAPEPTVVARVEPATTESPEPDTKNGGEAGKLDKPFIQVGSFGVAENAARLVKALDVKGVPARAQPLERQDGTTLTRVVAGPFDTASKQDAAFKQIRALGISDAIPVKR